MPDTGHGCIELICHLRSHYEVIENYQTKKYTQSLLLKSIPIVSLSAFKAIITEVLCLTVGPQNWSTDTRGKYSFFLLLYK